MKTVTSKKGTTCLVGKAVEDFNCDPIETIGGFKWMVECQEHHTYIFTSTKKAAIQEAKHAEFCERCQSI